jgi:hypothetical protein
MSGNHTSVYMRGLYDGLREGMSTEMTPKKFKMTLDSMTTISRKVFEAVPIQESWTANQIVTALARTTSTRPDLKTATGCLDTLKQCGLVKETERGLFRQVVPREVGPVATTQENAHTLTLRNPGEYIHAGHLMTQANTLPTAAEARELADQAGDPPEASPARLFGAMAEVLRKQAAGLIEMANDIEAGALAFEQDIEDANKRLERFNQLKALLAS